MNDSKVLLKAEGITKRFPGILALNNVDFDINKGEIHALIGQNGAGKSTLVKILVGDLEANSGHIEMEGNKVQITNPRKAIEIGISIVYQELSLLPNLTVAENIYMGREITKGIVIDKNEINSKSENILKILGVSDIDVKSKVEDLSIAQQQLVEISKALSFEPRILILDEPTSSLTTENAKKLFKIMKNLKKEGISIIYISHKLNEIIDNCDRGTILRDGQVAGVLDMKKDSEEDIVKLMIGQSEDKFYHREDFTKKTFSDVILEVKNLNVNSGDSGIDFKLHKGEILGLTGVLGSGIYKVGRALYGVSEYATGKIILNNKVISINSPDDALKNGIGLLTENRKKEGIFHDLSLMENVAIPSLKDFRFPFIRLINTKREQKEAVKYSDRVNIIRHSIEQLAKTLSGGNQQKMIIARWLLRDLDIIIFIEPTVGIDIGAKAEIYEHLEKLAQMGKGVIMISIDSKEILELADKILVMREGKLTYDFDRGSVSENELVLAVQGKEVRK